jgi:hypothetical protein
MDGLAVNIQVLEGEGTFRVQFVDQEGASHIGQLQLSADVQDPQRAVCLFSQIRRASSSKAGPDNGLRPSQVRKIMVGMNAKRDSRVSYVIRGLEWVQF